jgi:hypothetical protein
MPHSLWWKISIPVCEVARSVLTPKTIPVMVTVSVRIFLPFLVV